MQDLAVVPILFAVGVLGAEAADGVGYALVSALGKAVLVIVAIYIGGRFLLRPLLRLVADSRFLELFMAAVLLIVIGASVITAYAGLSMALGAFLAGLLLAETEYRHEVEVNIEPFKGLLLGLFFMTVGMSIDYRPIAAQAVWIIGAVVALMVVKAIIITLLCRLFGLPSNSAIEAGLLLSQGGEFAFVVVGVASSTGVLEPAISQFTLIVAGLSMVATPFVAMGARRLGAVLEHRSATADVATGNIAEVPDLEGHVILAGFGRVGRTLAHTLDAEAIPYIALDLSPHNVTAGRSSGLPVYYGDASRPEMMKRAHAEAAQAVVITMDDPERAERIAWFVRREWPDLPVFARARDRAHATRLVSAGASEAVPETVEASLQLAGRVLSVTGIPDDVIHRRLDAQRELELASGDG
jgi:CPA2 family monovalent cation:H+ antiporter-2